MVNRQHAVTVYGQESPRGRRRRRILAGLVVLAAIPAIGATLAASITINGGSGIEFGQGQVGASACDSTITVTPSTSWSTSRSLFEVDTITLTGVDLSAGGDDCRGKTFRVTLLDSSGTDLGFLLFAIAATDQATAADDFVEDAASTQTHTIAGITFSASSTLAATITAATKVDASQVARITLQTS